MNAHITLTCAMFQTSGVFLYAYTYSLTTLIILYTSCKWKELTHSTQTHASDIKNIDT